MDNSTSDDDMIIFDEAFALQKNLVPNSNPGAIRTFQDFSLITLSFGSFILNSNANRIMKLPKKKGFEYSGIIGLGFLKKYIIEINYSKNIFLIYSTLPIDTSKYSTIDLEKKTCICYFQYRSI